MIILFLFVPLFGYLLIPLRLGAFALKSGGSLHGCGT